MPRQRKQNSFRQLSYEQLEARMLLSANASNCNSDLDDQSLVANLDFVTDGVVNSSDGVNTPAAIDAPAAGEAVVPISFNKSALAGTGNLKRPTSLQFGPDGRLYVSEQLGKLHAYTIVRNGADDYEVTDLEQIDLIRQIQNHDDDGALKNFVTPKRLVTGLLVTGTVLNPVIFVSSSDPRIGAGPSGNDLNLDTNSGVVSRLTWNGTSWDQLDLVRGLPRSEENHGPNGLQLDPSTNTLYLAHGGNTNKGGPSNNFAFLPEFALSAAILAIDLDAIGETTYDLPTLDDEDQPGADTSDPFGGNNGKNQALLVTGGPVQVYAPGLRNPYDLVITSQGRMYAFDNGSNAGWGDVPAGEGPGGNATNEPVSGGGLGFGDSLHFITGPGYYGGHPNPTRSNTSNKFNSTNPQSPVSVGNPIESDFRSPAENGALFANSYSTNGIAEYTANNFGGQLQGDLIAAGFNNTIQRIKLNAAGDQAVLVETLFTNVGFRPLDVTLPSGSLSGTIWVADIATEQILVFEPSDGSGGTPGDTDGDGYTDDDEIANGTDPFNGADVPPDYDADFVSNLLDTDDDNDSILDENDSFAIDPDNGSATNIGVFYDWENEGATIGGILGLGFTGLMTNGIENYETLYDPGALTAGGAAGVFTVDSALAGSAVGATNTQQQAFQFGFNVAGETVPFVAKTSVLKPFDGLTPTDGQKLGLYLGTGDQDNYVEVVVAGDQGGSILVNQEIAGVATQIASVDVGLPGPNFVELHLTVDPLASTVQASYSSDGVSFVDVGAAISIPTSWLASSMALGLMSENPAGTALPVTWDFLAVERAASNASVAATVDIVPNGSLYGSSTFRPHSFQITNHATSGEQIRSVTIDLSTAFMLDVVFDPDGAAGDSQGRTLTPNSGDTDTGYLGFAFAGLHDGGYDAVQIDFDDFDTDETFTFSIDIDPTSIQGGSSPGPGSSGSVSGLELSGTTITVEYENGTVLSGDAFVIDGSLVNSTAMLNDAPRSAAPSIELLGVSNTPVILQDAAQTVRITGPAGATVRLLHVESALMLQGVPNDGFDIEPYESNRVSKVSHQTATLGAGGFVDLPVTLFDTLRRAGINHLMAVVVESDGRTSDMSSVLTVALKNLPPGSNLDGGPTTSALTVTPATATSGPITIGASLADLQQTVTAAEYFIDTLGAEGTGQALAAVDGVFDETNEAVSGVISAAVFDTLSIGTHTIYVRGQNSAGFWGNAVSTTFEHQQDAVTTDPPFSPVLRLDTTAGVIASGNQVSQWQDQSGSGNHLFSVGTQQPHIGLVQTPSGQAAVSFDGEDDRLLRALDDGAITGLPALNADRSMFLVARFHDASATGGAAYGRFGNLRAFGMGVSGPGTDHGDVTLQTWGNENDLVSDSSAFNPPGTSAGWMILSTIHTDDGSDPSDNGFLYRNGVEIAAWSQQLNTRTNVGSLLHGKGKSRLVLGEEIRELGHQKFDVAAWLVYDGALSNLDRQQVEAYLTATYLGAGASSADLDTDGDTDGLDFLMWQRELGDQDVSADDLISWKDQFGQIEPVTVVSAPLSRDPLAATNLIDAALAIERALGDDANETPRLAEESTFAETLADQVFADDTRSPATASAKEYESTETISSEIDAAKAPWLADELLERVFG